MKNPILWIVVAIILILLGTGLLTYSAVCVTVEKNGKKRSVVHGVYITFGIILIIISIIIFYLVAKDYNSLLNELKNAEKAGPGMALVPLPEKFGKWVTDNISFQAKNNVKFTKVIGNYMDGSYKTIKGLNGRTYIFYGTEPGKE